METLEDFIAYYGETWGRILFNESNSDINNCYYGECGY